MIPVSKPQLAKHAKAYLNLCIDSGWISSEGPFVARLEKRFAQYLGVRYAVAVTSGTASLHLAVCGLEIGRGDEVIVPALTIISPVAAILYTGAQPVLVDSTANGWNMDISQIEKKITRRTKAIIAVHLYGQPVDINPLLDIAKKHRLFLIEDVAESLGGEYQNRKLGSFGDVSCFSFYANKLLTTGEGGMAVTNKKTVYKKLQLFRDMARIPKKRFVHSRVGFTYRMSNLQAALGVAQLEEIEQVLEKKRSVAAFYNNALAALPGLRLPEEKPGMKNSDCMYAVLVEDGFGISRNMLRKKLSEKGVETRDFFVPMHRQPALLKLGLFHGEHYPATDSLSRRGLYLPSGPDITTEQLQYVCNTIKEIYDV